MSTRAAFWKHHDQEYSLIGPEEVAPDRRVVDLDERARNNAAYRFLIRELSMATIQVSLMTIPPRRAEQERITLPRRMATQVYCVVSGRALLRIGNQRGKRSFPLTSMTMFRTRHDTEATLAVIDENIPLRMWVITVPGVLDRDVVLAADDDPNTDISDERFMEWVEEDEDEADYLTRVEPLSFGGDNLFPMLPFMTHPQQNLRDNLLEVIYTNLDSPTTAGDFLLQEQQDNDMIVVVATGSGRFRISNSPAPLTVSAGNAFLVPRNVRLTYDSNQTCSIFRFWFRKRL
jgi:hypothetical protein